VRTSFSETQDCILGNSQPSPSTSSHGTPGQAGQALRGLIMLLTCTQDYVRDYSQPVLSKLANRWGLVFR
jgi:hypothetical protein